MGVGITGVGLAGVGIVGVGITGVGIAGASPLWVCGSSGMVKIHF